MVRAGRGRRLRRSRLLSAAASRTVRGAWWASPVIREDADGPRLSAFGIGAPFDGFAAR